MEQQPPKSPEEAGQNVAKGQDITPQLEQVHHHEPEKTELEKLMLHAVNDLQQNWDGYGSKVVLYVSLAVLLLAAGIYYTRSNEGYAESAWGQLSMANDPADFQTVVDSFPGIAASQWAELHVAESHLRNATGLMFQDRTSAVAELKIAEAGFQTILDQNYPAQIRSRALFGLGRVQETLSDGGLESARKTYERVVKDFPDTTVAELAQERIDALSKPSAQEFYAWFHAQNPKPEDRPAPQDGQPGETETMESLAPNIPLFGESLDESGTTTEAEGSSGQNMLTVPDLTNPMPTESTTTPETSTESQTPSADPETPVGDVTPPSMTPPVTTTEEVTSSALPPAVEVRPSSGEEPADK